MKSENIIIDVVSQTYDHLRDGAMQDFKNIMNLTKRWDRSKWNDSKKIYTFGNGTMLRFKSVDKLGKAKGPRRDILYINEANYINYNIYYQLSIRTFSDIYIDFNPVQRFWAHDEVLQGDDSEFLKVNYLDNEAIPDNVKKDMDQMRKDSHKSEHHMNKWKVYGLGEVGTLEGVIFENWDTIDFIPPDAEVIGCGLDFGFSQDPTAAVMVYRYNGKLILDEIIYETHLLNSEISERLKSIPNCEIYADSAEPKSIRELQILGHNIQGASKGKDSILHGINLIQEFDLLVTNSSYNLKDELMRYSWKEDKLGNLQNVPEDKNNHLVDGLRYIISSKLDSGGGEGNRVMIYNY